MDTDVLYWIWLSDALGASNKQTGALLSAIPDALEIYRMDAVALCDRVPELSRTVVENLSQKSLNMPNAWKSIVCGTTSAFCRIPMHSIRIV